MLERNCGVADTDSLQPLRPESVFYVGSIAKEITAACVLLLAFAEALALDQPLSDFFPNLPPWSRRTTLLHLLTHTSGIPTPYGTDTAEATNDEILPTLRALRGLEFEPGTAYSYSGAFVILAEVVRAVAAVALDDFAELNVFRPLGMRDTVFRRRRAQTIPGAVSRHLGDDDPRPRHYDPASNFTVIGDGGLWSSTADLARWDANLDDDQLADGRLPDGLRQPGKLSEGTVLRYGRGFDLRPHRGVRMEGHSGSFPGWSAQHLRFPDHRLSVIWLANTSSIDTRTLALRAAEVYLNGHLEPSAPSADELSIDTPTH